RQGASGRAGATGRVAVPGRGHSAAAGRRPDVDHAGAAQRPRYGSRGLDRPARAESADDGRPGSARGGDDGRRNLRATVFRLLSAAYAAAAVRLAGAMSNSATTGT